MNDAYLKRAIEKIPDKRALIVLAAKRARQLGRDSRPMIKTDELNNLDIALLEIAEGLLTYEMAQKAEDVDFLEE